MVNEKSLKDNPDFIKDLRKAQSKISKLKEREEKIFDKLCAKYEINGRPNSDIVWDFVFNEYDCLKNMV